MTYRLEFVEDAWKEWNNLDNGVKEKFKKKLEQRLKNPHVSPDKLRGMKNCYKIKLRSDGFRLVYSVDDDRIVVTVISVGKRDKKLVYKRAIHRAHMSDRSGNS